MHLHCVFSCSVFLRIMGKNGGGRQLPENWWHHAAFGTSGRLQMGRICTVGLKKWLHSLGATTSNPNDTKSALNGQDSHSLENHQNVSPPPKQAPEAPTACCMSGCTNCVWLEYAEKLTEYYGDGGEKSVKEINETITDPSIKAYLLHEIRMRSK